MVMWHMARPLLRMPQNPANTHSTPPLVKLMNEDCARPLYLQLQTIHCGARIAHIAEQSRQFIWIHFMRGGKFFAILSRSRSASEERVDTRVLPNSKQIAASYIRGCGLGRVLSPDRRELPRTLLMLVHTLHPPLL